MDFLDILDFVAFDLDAARELMKESEKQNERVETVQPKPVRKSCRGLCCPGGGCCFGDNVETIVFIVV